MPELAIYRIDIYDDAGIKHGSLTGTGSGGEERRSGFLSFSCTRRVNAAGLLIFTLRGDHPLLSSMSDKWQFELWRKPIGQVWTREFVGIFRGGQWRYDDKSNIIIYCYGLLSLLSMRIINYAANTVSRTVFTAVDPAETISKSLVTYNITSDATTANGRKRDGTNWPATQITVEADGGGGNLQPWYCFGSVLLESLQKLSQVGGGDFDLVKTSPTAYQFRWYAGQIGTDRSFSIKFSVSLGNMGSPEVDMSWENEKTVACVWGQGDDAMRDYVTRTGSNYAADNDIEMFINASDVPIGDTYGLNTRGDQKLEEYRAKRLFRFNALQAPTTLYGIHYFLGDLVTVLDPLNGAEYIQKVSAITLTWASDGKQSVNTELIATNT